MIQMIQKENSPRFFFLGLILILSAFAAFTARAAETVDPQVSEIPKLTENGFHVLCYHNVYCGANGRETDDTSVSLAQFTAHLIWLKENGYNVIDIDDVVAAREGARPLPPKAVLLTFDDGRAGFYTYVFPLLKLCRFPAVLALTGQWLESDEGTIVQYGSRKMRRADFLAWSQIKEMVDSGLVEVASHSYDLHRGIPGNPQGNRQPAAVTAYYDAQTGKYESADAYRERIIDDLKKNNTLLTHRLGKTPRVIVWPYGKSNFVVNAAADSLGLTFQMTLEPKYNTLATYRTTGRHLIHRNTAPQDLGGMLSDIPPHPTPRRIVHMDLDYIYDPDAAQQNKNLDLVVERIKQMGVNTVYLQAYSDHNGGGYAEALYFPNRYFPVKADLFNRVAWQLKTRSHVTVYAWMPVTAFQVPENSQLPYVMEQTKEGLKPSYYKRLSVFSPQVREMVLEIYEDLARHADFDGILFHDDGFFGDYEDAGQHALTFYKEQWELPDTIEGLQKDPQVLDKWARLKTQYLIDFTHRLTDRLRRYRLPMVTARNIYARLLTHPESQTWFAQSFPLFLMHYDYTAVMAMPYMENVEEPGPWLENLVSLAKKHDPGLHRTVFELQSKDWRNQTDVPGHVLLQQFELIRKNGLHHFGYYPDDFIKNHPPMEQMKSALAVQRP